MKLTTIFKAYCEDCPFIEPKCNKNTFKADGKVMFAEIEVSCEHEELCERLHSRLKQASE